MTPEQKPAKEATEAELRHVGFTAAALDYPRDEASLRLLCAYNGVEPGDAPPGWWYYPNPAVRDAWRRVAEVVDVMIAEQVEARLGAQRLREEADRLQNGKVLWELVRALRDLPPIPSRAVLMALSSGAKWPEDSNQGKLMQREAGSEKIPYKSEMELGAGFWHRIREAILHFRECKQ